LQGVPAVRRRAYQVTTFLIASAAFVLGVFAGKHLVGTGLTALIDDAIKAERITATEVRLFFERIKSKR